VQPLPHALGSPVPAQRVFDDRSLGSSASAATLLCSKVWETYDHSGSSASASFVRQTPPPAFASQRRQLPATQYGSISTAIERPAKLSVFAL